MSATSEGSPSTASQGHSRPGVVLTALGPDRPGLVKELASHVRRHGGNIEDTRMSKLGGEFAVLVLITGDQSQLNEIKSSARELETVLGVTCFFKDTLAEAEATSGVCYQLEASGFDRVGIVESISAVLATRHVNVTSFASRLGNAPHTGTQMFFLSAELRLPEGAKLAELETELSDVCEKEGLEYILQEA